MATVSVNAPKTPVTKGSSGIAAATVPNICKMPGPPAPFVPTPLPNIGSSGKAPDGYSTSVTIEGNPVAIQGASFGSSGDVASQGTGGGIVSNNVEGPTKFIGPGSFDVQIEGKNVQLLSDPMMNNCGPGGSPPNAATMGGVLQVPLVGNPPELDAVAKDCNDSVEKDVANGKLTSTGGKPSCATRGTWKHKCCKDAVAGKYDNVKCEDGCGKANCRLDVAIVNPAGSNNVTHIFDYKFNCTGPPKMSKSQARKYGKAFPTASIGLVG
jgi:hypothetical protein